MSVKRIGIIDYGVGNLLNVAKACEYLGANTEIITSADRLPAIDLAILPGVGSCQAGMEGLERTGLHDALLDYTRTGKPLVGICLGMQLLADSSSENGEHKTLGLIPGTVTAIPQTNHKGETLTIPNINWLRLQPNPENVLPFSISPADYFYFVHSYRFVAEHSNHLLASVQYQDEPISAIVRKDNIIGMQFHPEKSGQSGLELLKQIII